MIRYVLMGVGCAIVVTSAVAAAPQDNAAARTGQRAQAVFAGGCFWCTESDFDKVPGVISTTSGYTGGKLRNPTYEQVSAGKSGHIEAVRVVYDPARVSYAMLVERLMRTVDPVDSGGQFCDRGYQYRSAIFFANPRERQVVRAVIARLTPQKREAGNIATLVLPRAAFYPAEGYHQDYYKKNPVRYRFYRLTCGRDARVEKAWGKSAR
ncbi:MAG: peptide-methionine (S)-S-oxide reductase MsrA [Sphingomonas bacterium]|nr:peptide-methionine (S)-S-oxide reductase MsrA [Sphingomonas bacterium]